MLPKANRPMICSPSLIAIVEAIEAIEVADDAAGCIRFALTEHRSRPTMRWKFGLISVSTMDELSPAKMVPR